MKLTILTMFLFAMQISASVIVHGQTLTIQTQNESLRDILREIERQSSYRFFYNDAFAALNKTMQINIQEKSITETMDELLAATEMTFRIMDNNLVVIAPRKELQQRTITGKVIDNSGQPLVGVTIMVKGTTTGTISDIIGNYSITVSEGANTLVFSFVGMATVEEVIGDRTIINVVLSPDYRALDEVVVVGYGTRIREELTGAVSTVSSQQLQSSSNSNVIGRLQGHVSGVTVTNSNLPGGGSTIRVRGIGTINAPEPLYVIDGIPVGPGTSINPNDIESISILKDASSAAIYGTRGANGVIIISTKRGKIGAPPTITFNATRGMSSAANRYELANTQEHAELQWLIFKNRGVAPNHSQYGSGATPVIPDYIRPSGAMEGDPGVNPALYSYPEILITRANKEGTDWFNEITRTGIRDEYDISFTGGTENVTYSTSASYLNEEGMMIHTGFDRFTFRNNTDARLSNWVKVGQSINVSRSQAKGDRRDNHEQGPIGYSNQILSIIPVYDIEGNFAGNGSAGLGTGVNPVAELYRRRNNTGRDARIIGNVFGEFTFMDGLVFRSLLGYNYNNGNSRSYTLTNPEAFLRFTDATYNQGSSEAFQWNWSNTLQFDRTFADIHKFGAILGTESIESRFENIGGERTGYFSEDVNYMRLSSGDGNMVNNGDGWEWTLFSIFGRVNYSLMGKYLFEATVRRDGSSKFGFGNRYATFPAFSGAWVISSESFMDGTENWLNFLKLRLGWGKSGNDKIGDYNIYSTFGAIANWTNLSSYPMTGSNTSSVSGFIPIAFGNPDVTWESTTTLNLGLDAYLANNTINLGIDVWERNTDDMLYRIGVPAVGGVGTHPFVNIGSMKNRGFDVELGYRNTALSGRLRYSANLVLSRYVNEILKLSDNVEETIVTGQNRQMFYLSYTAGTAFPEFYGYIADGFFQTAEEAAAHPTAFGTGGTYNAVGRVKYRDLNDDGVIDDKDRTYIGNPHPDLTGGMNLELGYGNFDLSIFLYGSYGNDIIHYARRSMEYSLQNANNSKDRLYRSWGSPYLNGDNSKATIAIADNNVDSEQPSTLFVEDGSYLRVKTLMLSYNLPNSLTSKLSMKGLRVYTQLTNPLTFTKYTGLDPDLDASGTGMGIDRGPWPTIRQVIFGLSLTL